MEGIVGATPVARLTSVTHRYGKTLALEGVDLQIPAGCMAGIIGPDGVGKSTLLALIAGARRIQSGTVAVLGGDLSSRGFRQAVAPRIAYMPQGLGGNLYATLSVFENVDFFARLFGQRPAERQARIADLLASTGLAPFKDRPAGKLSGGMKQKLGLCCALIHDPELLILDEPTTGVDPLSRRQFWQLIERIRARQPAMSVVVATAYMDEAERFDWLAAFDDGKVLAVGRPDAIKSRGGAATLEEAFIQLLPEAKRRGHEALKIPPRPTHDGEAAIEAHGLTMRFGAFTAVDQVSFKIERGEIFGFLGSNGCGKTTTMKMLTGLLPASAGEAKLFGKPIDARDMETRKRVGYMSQSFSLYSELTVRQNLELHAQLFHVPAGEIAGRVNESIAEFTLGDHADSLAGALPLGMRQRLSLAVAVVHRPEMLILDEPTSGVDPIARDLFWQRLIDLSRHHGVTIFVSTHFMNEGERCDRISLMHAGRVLASAAPAELMRRRGAASLEEAFISYLEEASGAPLESPILASQSSPAVLIEAAGGRPRSPSPSPSPSPIGMGKGTKIGRAEETNSQVRLDGDDEATSSLRPITPSLHHSNLPPTLAFSPRRLFAYAHREALELWRDPVRLTFAILGSVILMLILGYGISLDVEDLRFAALDRDQTPRSRDYIQNIAASRYFIEQPALADTAELDRRMRSGEVSVAIELPNNFAIDLKRGRAPEVAVWVDGAMPFRGETIKGYLQGLHAQYLTELALSAGNGESLARAARIETRYRYNQDFRSLDAMVPAVIPMLLIFIPAVLMAVGVVREKELGSIVNLYVTPVTRLEFLLGKQLPYIVLSMASFVALVLVAVWVFRVPLKGSFMALGLGALLYVTATTGFGLLMSAFSRTQIAALAGTAVATMLPTIQFSGFTDPVSSLEGAGYYVGQGFPATYFLIVSRGVFTKALGFADLASHLAILATFIPVLTILSLLLLKKQGK